MKELQESKTSWANIIFMIVLALWPKGAEWVGRNPSVAIYVVAGVNWVLRLFTSAKIKFPWVKK